MSVRTVVYLRDLDSGVLKLIQNLPQPSSREFYEHLFLTLKL